MNEDIVFFVSDTHFGHENCLRWRPQFSSIEEHDEYLIHRWNEKVPDSGIIYHLGDFSFRNEKPTEDYLSRLNFREFNLILGNHDKDDWEKLKNDFPDLRISIYDYWLVVKLFKRKLHLCHYAFRTWPGMYRGIYHLHGHSHGQLLPYVGSMDVSVDCIDFAPISFRDIEWRMEAFAGRDHHTGVVIDA